MAEITSSSVTSSEVPAKLVSRRSIRIARLLSALPRRAVTSWRRSVSLRGRKSIDVLLLSKKGPVISPSVGKALGAASVLGGQLGQEEINALVDAARRTIDGEHLAPTEDIIPDILRPEQHT